jgi:hypothetical protein
MRIVASPSLKFLPTQESEVIAKQILCGVTLLLASTAHAGNSTSGGVRGPILQCDWKKFGSRDSYNIAVFDTGDARREFKYLLEISAKRNGVPASVVGNVRPLANREGFEGFKEGQLTVEISRAPSGQISALLLSGSAAPFAGESVVYVPCDGSDIIR